MPHGLSWFNSVSKQLTLAGHQLPQMVSLSPLSWEVRAISSLSHTFCSWHIACIFPSSYLGTKGPNWHIQVLLFIAESNRICQWGFQKCHPASFFFPLSPLWHQHDTMLARLSLFKALISSMPHPILFTGIYLNTFFVFFVDCLWLIWKMYTKWQHSRSVMNNNKQWFLNLS